MRMRLAGGFVAIAVVLAGSAMNARAGDSNAAWDAVDAAMKDLRAAEADLRIVGAAIDGYREAIAARANSPVAAAQKALDEAEKAAASARSAAGLDAEQEKLQKARAARDEKVLALASEAPSFKAAADRRAEVQKQIAALVAQIDSLKEEQLLELGRLRLEEQQLGKTISSALRAWWSRGEVKPLYQAADALYKAFGPKASKAPAIQQAEAKVKPARKALADAIDALPLESAGGKALLTRQEAQQAKVAAAQAKVAELQKPLIGEGKTVTVTIKAMDRRTKQEVDKRLSMWIPPNTEYIRGIIIAHPMIGSLATGNVTRLAAARAGLATMVYDNFSYDTKEAIARLDALFEKFAAESKHPELKGAPMMLGGLSASVLATRNIACVAPERVFGIVHAAGGNMQEMPDDGRGMIQVPFIAHNGEFEWCGPVGGIRPEYGQQTQWVMIREQMLRLWRDKHEHRMSLIVIPHADHGAWNHELTALFIRKCAQYRLPAEKRDGSTPAKCVPLPANKGWLTDADLDHPRFEPAPYDAYKGDKNHAFWHFDEEMARAVYEFHKGKFILPDPTKQHPVPADWPGK